MEHNAINTCLPANNSACENGSTDGKAFLRRNKTISGNSSKPFDSSPRTNGRHSVRNAAGFGIYLLNAAKN